MKNKCDTNTNHILCLCRTNTKIILEALHFQENIIYSEIFSKSKFILLLTKTKKEFQETPIGKCILQIMMCTSGIDMANSTEPADIDTCISNAAWAIRKTYHNNIKSLIRCSTNTQTDTIFNVPSVAHWYIGEQTQPNRSQ